jgi:ribonuclease BN (tRNA processing enzyme)
MKVKIHGARGSYPVSIPPARIEEILRFVWEFSRKKKYSSWKQLRKALDAAPRSKYQIYGGATTCLELKADEAPFPIFFDAGTGLTGASHDRASALTGKAFREGKGKAAIFLSHTHWDHILGLPSCEQIYVEGNQFLFYGVHKDLRGRIATLFQDEYFPVPFKAVERNFEFNQIPLNSSVRLGKLSISHFPQTHPGGSFAYRVDNGKRALVFATDTSLKNITRQGVIPGQNFYSNSDVLILDAQFSPEDMISREDWGHAEIYTAVDFAVRENTKRLYLFHQSPTYSDAEIERQLKRARQYLHKKFGKKHHLEVHMTVEGDEIRI